MTDYNAMFEVVKESIFETMFNYSSVALKSNVLLTILNNGIPVKGFIYNNVICALMPNSTSMFYVFLCSDQAVSNLVVTSSGWTTFEDLLNEYNVNADFISTTNQMIPKGMVYGKVAHTGETVFAIDAAVYQKFNMITETYLVIDADLVHNTNNRTVMSSVPSRNASISTMLGTISQHPANQFLGFVNGFAYLMNTFPTVGNPVTDYIELYHNGDTKFTFSIDLTHRNTYMDTAQSIYKDIIVIPSSLTDGGVCTFDAIELVVFSASGKGVVLPFLASNSVTQLTHASFSIGSYLIDAAFDKLGVTDGTLYVIVNDFGEDHTSVMNGCVTEQLYLLDDAHVLSAAMNSLNPKVSYWNANSLGSSIYAKYLTDMSELSTYNPGLISNQIKALGYYSFVKTLCQHNGEISGLGSGPVSSISIPIPPFWSDTGLQLILYNDGKKIPFSWYTSVVSGESLNVTFNIPVTLIYSFSVIQYDLIVSPSAVTSICTPSQDLRTVSIDKPSSGSVHVFIKTSTSVTGITTESFDGYVELTITSNRYFTVVITDTGYILSFKPYSYGNEFVITTDSLTIISAFPDIDLSSGNTLFYVPQCAVVGSNDKMNVLVAGDYDVYLNGRYMINGLDYCVNSILGSDNVTVGGYSIIIQNLKFLIADSTNLVEICRTNRTVLSSDAGYIVGGIIPRNSNNEAWIPGISRLYINGKLVPFEKVTQTTTNFVVDPSYWSNSNVYQFVNSISSDFYSAYLGYMDNGYFQGRVSINKYLTNGYVYNLPNPIVISDGGKIYSSYLNEIIGRIISGELVVNYINEDTDIVGQLAAYESLKRFDALFSGSNMIDKRFVDLFPSYLATLSISDINSYLYINRLVSIILGTDQNTDYHIVYTGS